jgi:cysteinyl-tRNA synthetase
VTVRVDGRSTSFPAGSEVSIAAIGDAARAMAEGDTLDHVQETALASGPAGGAGAVGTGARPAAPLRQEMTELEGRFVAALEHDDARDAVAALLELDAAIAGRVRAGEDSPDLDSASATFRALIVRLGERAAGGGGAPRETVDTLVGALLELRDAARANRDFAAADRIRDRLAEAGIEVRDGAEGSTWVRSGGG